MYSRLNGDEDGLAGWWTSDDWHMTALTDRSGNGNHGTIVDVTYAKGMLPDQLAMAPQFLKVAGSDAGVRLNWKMPGLAEDLIGYKVTRDDGKTFEVPKTSEVWQIWHDTDVASGDSYCYTVETLYDSREGDSSNEVCTLIASDYAITFNGTDHHVGISKDSGLEFIADQSFTIELWARPDEYRYDPAIISDKDWRSGRNKGFVFAQTEETWKVSIGDGTNRKDIECGTIFDGEWHHLAMVIDRENRKMTVFQDGDKTEEADISSIGDMNSGLDINMAQDGTGDYEDNFKGATDEVRIWRVARTRGEIRSWMFTGLTGNEDGLAAYWAMNETTLADNSGNGRDGAIYGAGWTEGVPTERLGRIPKHLKVIPDSDGGIRLIWERPGLASGLSDYVIRRNGTQIDMKTTDVSETSKILTRDADTIFGNSYCYTVRAVYDDAAENDPCDETCAMIASNYALHFDGKDDYVDVGHGIAPEDQITVEAWIYKTDAQGDPAAFGFGDDEMNVYAGKDWSERFSYWDDENGWVESDFVIKIGKWHHLAWVLRNGPDGYVKFYVNGEYAGEGIQEKAFPSFAPHCRIGTSYGDIDEYFPGYIKDLRLWNVIRTDEQIQAAMNSSLSGDEEGLVAYWPMNEPDEILWDRSGNGHHGTIHGAEWGAGD